MRWRPDIEGLRGVAVLLVVLYHAEVAWLRGGFVGVDVFFVLSGYLITRLLLAELREKGRLDLPAFYARRARRLVPAALLTVVVTLAASWLVLPPLSQAAAVRTGAAAAAYWSNLRFAFEAGDYFGEDLGDDPLLHTWSLAVEEQFYLAWPLLVAGAAWLGRRRPAAVPLTLAGVTLVSFLASLHLTREAPHWAFFGPHSRAWEFGVGAVTGLVPAAGARLSRTLGAVGWVGLAAVVLSGAAFDSSLPWPGAWALLPALGTALVLASGAAAPGSSLARALGWRPLQALGRLSYTWYLWHWPALVLAAAAAGPLTPAQRLAVAAGSLALSAVTHRLVEAPLRFHPRLARFPALSLGTMLGASATTFALTLVALPVVQAQQPHYAQAAEDLPRSYREGCHLQAPAAAPRFDCVYGDEGSATRVVLFGDSHAAQWFPALERVALERAWRLEVHTKSNCTPASVPARAAGRPYPECDEWREAVMRSLEADPPAAVVLATYAATVQQTPEALAEGLRASIARLSRSVGVVAYVKDNPAPGFDVLECLSREGGERCGFDAEPSRRARAWERAALEGTGAVVVDTEDLVCPGARCPVEVGAAVLYRDANHLTSSFVVTLAPVFDAALAGALRR